jgi:hypothetical protein
MRRKDMLGIITTIRRHHLALVLLLVFCSTVVQAQSSSFTYQGKLTESSSPANGPYEMEFRLYDSVTDGAQQPQAAPVTVSFTVANGNIVNVTAGIFSVPLDFGSDAFPGADRYLQISVRRSGDQSFTVLPRQPITGTPYAVRSNSAATADNATDLKNQLSSAGTLNNPNNPVDWSQLKNVPSSIGTSSGSLTAGPGLSIAGQVIANTGVLAVGASGPLSSTGGQTPTIALSGVIPVAHGGTGSATKAFVDLTSNQTIGGTKTFSKVVTESLSTSGMGQVNRYDPALVATLRWDLLPRGYGDFEVGHDPVAIAFDGSNIWVANEASKSVTKLRAADGASLGTYQVGTEPKAIAFDGSNIWVANYFDSTVTKLSASNGQVLGTFASGGMGPQALVAVGKIIWILNRNSSTITQLNVRGEVVGHLSIPDRSNQLAFDGANVWLTATQIIPHDSTHHSLLRIPVDGGGIDIIPVGKSPQGVAFDGVNVWVANNQDGTVTKVGARDLRVLGTFPTGPGADGIAYDGTCIWVTNYGASQVTKLRPSDGANMGTTVVGRNPMAIAFDGNNVWIANGVLTTSVSKR